MRRLHATAHVAPGSTIVEGAAISLPPEFHHGVTSPCVSRLDYPARFGLDRSGLGEPRLDRKSTRLNSSHLVISYAVFCLKKKKKKECSVDLRDSRISIGLVSPLF